LFATKHSVIGFWYQWSRMELKSGHDDTRNRLISLSKVLVEKRVPQLDCIALFRGGIRLYYYVVTVPNR
jgi:hypothetical protein